MDLWGSCITCERWFYMGDRSATCPVCHSAPAAVADRGDTADPAGAA
jgi:hypothetical protein